MALLNRGVLTWSYTMLPCELNPDDAAYEFAPSDQRPALLAALKADLEAGSLWRWCDIEVYCHMPGVGFLHGLSSRRGVSYKDQREFEELGEYDVMRREAADDLDRRVAVVVDAATAFSDHAAAEAAVNSNAEANRASGWKPQPNDVVYCVMDDPPLRGVVVSGAADPDSCVYVRYDGNDFNSVESVDLLAKWPPSGAVQR